VLSEQCAWNESMFEDCFFAIMQISQTPGMSFFFVRKFSRIIRLIRFLVTALPTFFVTVMPSLVWPLKPGWYRAMNHRLWIFFPVFASCMKDALLRSRSFFVKVWFGFIRFRTRLHPVQTKSGSRSITQSFNVQTSVMPKVSFFPSLCAG